MAVISKSSTNRYRYSLDSHVDKPSMMFISVPFVKNGVS
ncbi:hypothetical protein H206_05303 [Candidatus Electrothrix aarhusensis]|uniref:Uncharacterized protein n=1 Tax=Candidatus Electrothrix aarhusensis TaxID=1859131 RepID=A0A3S3UBQ2_9BACT|nr:hypothetical protein H206_05303 [Candidatus Electrothrix aarhusensis]